MVDEFVYLENLACATFFLHRLAYDYDFDEFGQTSLWGKQYWAVSTGYHESQ
jgi:hypothetical protein